MKIKIDTTYLAEISGITYRLRFQPISNVPSFTHRVWISDSKQHNGIPVNYLHEDFKPSRSQAEFYFSQHIRNGEIISKKQREREFTI